jgi:hypothetical protein
LDGEAWTEIDWLMDINDFRREAHRISSDIPTATEFCFIPLTQTGKNHSAFAILTIHAFDIFGTLLE